jgi:hypothetical protein
MMVKKQNMRKLAGIYLSLMVSYHHYIWRDVFADNNFITIYVPKIINQNIFLNWIVKIQIKLIFGVYQNKKASVDLPTDAFQHLNIEN